MNLHANRRGVLAATALVVWAATALSQPKSNVDFWLASQPAASAPAGGDVAEPASRPAGGDSAARPDALPGVVVTSDGQCTAGMLFTTAEKNWEVWVDSDKRWRFIPPIVVLSITPVLVEEQLEPEWRWKEMGSDEKIFSGRSKPTRRFLWTFRLIDGTTLTGAVKGQPLWVETGKGKKLFIIHERSDGEYGQKLQDLVYPSKIIISRRAMEKQNSTQRDRGTEKEKS